MKTYLSSTRIRQIGLALLGSVAGCLPSGPDYEPMCVTTAECGPGKTCDQGICWGNPPDRPFAAVLVPPGEGWPDLATTDVPELAIASDGWVQNLRFADTGTIEGRVVLACGDTPDCDPTVSIDAQVSFVIHSRIPGRPDTIRTVTSLAGMPAGQPSFTVALPLADEPYEVLVVPGRSTGVTTQAVNPSEMAPPMHDTLLVQGDTTVEWTVGDPEQQKIVVGQVVDLVGSGIADMQVYALGTLDAQAPVERSSSITTTDAQGNFVLRIPLGIEPTLDFVAAPVEPGALPTLVVSDLEIPDPANVAEPIPLPQRLQMPSLDSGMPVAFTIPVRGRNSNGDEVPVRGAAVRVTTHLSGDMPNTTATFSSTTFTDDAGNAVLNLLPGNAFSNRTYAASVEPLPGSEHATLYNYMIDIGSEQGGYLAPIQLKRRVAVGGAVYTAGGEPASQTTVTARLAPGFRQGLAAAERAVVDNLQLASASTDTSGRFVMWLDDKLAESTAVYDLEFAPADSLAPLWLVRNITLSDRDETGVLDLDDIKLPSASYARGRITTPAGVTVPEASLRLYELVNDSSPCGMAECVPTVIYRGLSASQGDGVIRLVLPE